jgi:1,6-anhydro-N-acetylmuramate kinase
MDYIALGCMTGTSLDGIDCSLVKTDGVTYLNDIANEFTPYSKNLRDRLSNVLVHNYLTDPSLLKSLSDEYKVAINNLINKHDEKIDVIGIHGQTVLHDPSLKLSLQLYDKSSLYNTHAPIICNFRKNDPTIILCGGGRKNLTLQKLFRQHFRDVYSIDEYGLDGDYIESQGMALLAIRFIMKKKSTFTSTTGIKREVYLGEKC